MNILVTGSGGFIGGHLVSRLIDDGFSVRAVDIKPLEKWWQAHKAAENISDTDLRLRDNCWRMCAGIDQVYSLAADMGGIGHIETHRADCALHNVLINAHMLMAARLRSVKRFLFTSSACVYAAAKQDKSYLPALKESDAWPAEPEAGYGEEKLYSERLCQYEQEDYGLEVRVPRLHNVYGPRGSWNDGREKAPAAICRKVAEAKLAGLQTIETRDPPKGSGLQSINIVAYPPIEIWGDGTQTRSFMWIGDCVEGLRRLMDSDVCEPINLGSAEQVTINDLVGMAESIAGVKLQRTYDTSKPQGVRGRSSDNELIREKLGWQPTTQLWVGLKRTYDWIEEQVRAGHFSDR